MKFDIEYREIEIYTFPSIEAESESEAAEIVEKLMEGKKFNYHHDSDGEIEIREAN